MKISERHFPLALELGKETFDVKSSSAEQSSAFTTPNQKSKNVTTASFKVLKLLAKEGKATLRQRHCERYHADCI
jgi:hypothetical protein